MQASGMSRAFVSLGSNLGDREAHLRRALQALRATRGIKWLDVSRIYETDPVGPLPQGPYLNAVAAIETGLEPRALLKRLLQIEAEEGRIRHGVRDEARTLDLDLLLFADRCIDEDALVVPHPRMHERGFVLSSRCASWRRSGCIRVRERRSLSSRHAYVIRWPSVSGETTERGDQAAVSSSSSAGRRIRAAQLSGPVELA
jgi:2-amino-4-hydroxy-6-hydroxymethyldihydropteridine diphosphokinase